MHSLALLALLFAGHDSYHWEMSCDEWNQARIEILSDEDHIQDAKEYLIDYFYTKVPDKTCRPWSIGRKQANSERIVHLMYEVYLIATMTCTDAIEIIERINKHEHMAAAIREELVEVIQEETPHCSWDAKV